MVAGLVVGRTNPDKRIMGDFPDVFVEIGETGPIDLGRSFGVRPSVAGPPCRNQRPGGSENKSQGASCLDCFGGRLQNR